MGPYMFPCCSKREMQRQTLRREGQVKTEAGITAVCLQAKGGQQPPKAKRKAWDRFSLRALRKNQTYQHLDLGFLASRTVRPHLVFNHPVCGILLWWPQETNTISVLLAGDFDFKFISVYLILSSCHHLHFLSLNFQSCRKTMVWIWTYIQLKWGYYDHSSFRSSI